MADECFVLKKNVTFRLVKHLNTKKIMAEKELQDKTTMIIVSFFLGGLGIHRLMMGYKNWWLQLLTAGGCGIWALIDFIQIATGNMGMADGRPLKS